MTTRFGIKVDNPRTVANSGLLVASCAMLLGACAAPNDREMLGRIDGGTRIGLLAPSVDRPEKTLKPEGPSLTGLDRSDWAPVTVEQPVDGVYGWHRYARVYYFTDKTSRQRGGPVTALSALERSGPVQTKLVLEAAASGPLAFYDLVAMPFRAITAPPWEDVRTVPRSYWRSSLGTPVTGSSEADSAAPAGSVP